MSTAQFTIPLIVVVPGQIIAASLWNSEYQNIFTNLNPLGIGAYSDTDAQMQTSTDPFPSGTSRPTSLGGELERLRYILNLINGQTYWYQHPQISLSTLNGLFPGGLLNGSSIVSGSITTTQIAGLTILGSNIANNTITNAQIANNTIGAGQIANASITETQLATSVAGNGLTGGAGTPLAVNVDNLTLDISADKVEVKALGITGSQIANTTISSGKLDSSVPGAVGLKSIQNFTITVTFNNTQSNVNQDTTISSVNTAKAVAVITSLTLTNTGSIAVKQYTLTFTSATNLRANVILAFGSAGTSTVTLVVTIIEFN